MSKRLIVGRMCLLSASMAAASLQAEAPVNFEEVFSLVRSNLTGISEADLSKAAALGFVEKLQGKVELTDVPSASGASSLVSRTNTFDTSFAYVRVDRVASGLGAQITDAVKSGKKLKGLVLDLRFAKGNDYDAVADAVNAFLADEKPILKWGEKVAKTSARSEVIDLPVVALINRQTTGAAEALAGALREQQVALLIGNRTAGQAVVFDDFTLSNGQHLKIARTKVGLSSGEAIGAEGIAPDITVEADEKNERRWLEDPYLPIAKPSQPAGPAAFLTSVTNRLSRRPNSAEIARRHREAANEDAPETPRPSESVPAVVQDAALSRALDFLKGMAVPRLRDAK